MRKSPALMFGSLAVMISTHVHAEALQTDPSGREDRLACLGGYGFTPKGEEKAYRSGIADPGNRSAIDDRSLTVWTDRYSLDAWLDHNASEESAARKSSFYLHGIGTILRYDFPKRRFFGGQPWEGAILNVDPKHSEYILPIIAGFPAVRIRVKFAKEATVRALILRFSATNSSSNCSAERVIR